MKIVLFDGECNVCDSFVNYLIDRDAKKELLFASQQSDVGQRVMKQRGVADLSLDTMVLVDLETDQVYTHSEAVVRTLATLGGWYGCLSAFLLVPRFLRDFGYNMFAKYRIKMFGMHEEQEMCRRLTPDMKQRFLQFRADFQVPDDDDVDDDDDVPAGKTPLEEAEEEEGDDDEVAAD